MFLFKTNKSYIPFQKESEGSNSSCGKGMPVNDKNIMARPTIERSFCDYGQSSVPKLKRNHGYVRLKPLKITLTTSISCFHLVCFNRGSTTLEIVVSPKLKSAIAPSYL